MDNLFHFRRLNFHLAIPADPSQMVLAIARTYRIDFVIKIIMSILSAFNNDNNGVK